jgi:hypothetical protein
MPDQIDFTSIFEIQKNYLTNLNAITDASNATLSYYKDLSTELDALNKTYKDKSAASSVTLDHQNEMKEIITKENQRLTQKKVGIDNAYNTQKRLIELNESYRLKNAEYINILIVIIATIIIYLALLLISRNIPFIPIILINILMGILFAVSIILIITLVLKINARDSMNFQKRIFVQPYKQEGNVFGSVSGNITGPGLFQSCIGDRCCGNGTIWNAKNGSCSAGSAFTLMNENGNNFSKTTSVIPYVPYEFNSYAKI